jgi:hypothetical protein
MFSGAYPVGGQPDGGFAYIQTSETNFIADAGLLGVAGQAASFSAAATLTPDAAQCGLVGSTLTLQAAALLTANSGQIGLVGSIVAVVAGALLSIGDRELLLPSDNRNTGLAGGQRQVMLQGRKREANA